ncbi:MAG TPA: ABC transporter permease [Thermomicrobiaceae bacterium]|nr:ABC transporter permease [Thermomicrobiaceae bacterium]
MVPVARKNLLADKVRLLVSIGGVTFAVILVLVVRSLYEGYYQEIGAFVETMPVDIWVTQQSAGGLLYTSVLPASSGPQVAAVPGVRRVVAMDRQRLMLEHDGRSIDAFLMAFNVPSTAGGALGLPIPEPGQVAIDGSTAAKYGLKVGDTITARGVSFRLSTVTSMPMVALSGIAIVSWDDGQALLGVPGYVSSWLVNVAAGADVSRVAGTIGAQVPGVAAVPREQFASANRSQLSGTFIPIITVLLGVAFIVGSAVVGITIYTATTERWREFGVLKAIGASTGTLFRIVLQQSVLVCATGFAIGVPLTYLVNHFARRLVPEFITLVRWQDALLALGVVLGMALVASVIPVRRLARIDPAEVFRG